MKIGCDWKREIDKQRRFCFEFEDEQDFVRFFKDIMKYDTQGEVLNLRIWKLHPADAKGRINNIEEK